MDTNFIIIVGLAAAAALAFSCFWFSPRILGNSWMALAGVNCSDAKNCKKKTLITFLAYFAAAVTLFMIQIWAGAATAKAGLVVGTWVSLGIAATGILITYLWEGRSFRLFLITAGNLVFSTILMSTLIGHLIGAFYH